MRLRLFRKRRKLEKHQYFQERWQDLQFGLGNEKRFFHAWQDRAHYPNWVKNIRKATKEEDDNGVDAVVGTKDIGDILLQLKSSESGVAHFLRAHGSDGILPLVVQANDTPEFIRQQTLMVLYRARQKGIDQTQSITGTAVLFFEEG